MQIALSRPDALNRLSDIRPDISVSYSGFQSLLITPDKWLVRHAACLLFRSFGRAVARSDARIIFVRQWHALASLMPTTSSVTMGHRQYSLLLLLYYFVASLYIVCRRRTNQSNMPTKLRREF